MLQLTNREGGRIDIAMDGKVDAAAMERVLDELILHMETADDARLLFDITDFHMPSLDAIGVKFSKVRSLFGMLKKIDRIAILTDEKWMHQASKLENMMLPGIRVKAFLRDQRTAAESWLSAA